MNAFIEPDILPVCEALNAYPNVCSTFSCEGHPCIPLQPYVTFEAPIEFAYKVHQALNDGHGNGSLTFCWRLSARFDAEGKLVYLLEPSDIRIIKRPWFKWFAWLPKVMIDELQNLAKLIRNL